MTDEEEPDATVGLRVERGGPVVEGSDREPCADCGKDVFLSPGTRRSQRDGLAPDRVLCLTCVTEGAQA